MKRIINSTEYDTDSATIVDIWSSSIDDRDCHLVRETLYQKDNGEYFLHLSGGDLSPYKEETIVTFSPEQARYWLADHGDPTTYNEHFGTCPE